MTDSNGATGEFGADDKMLNAALRYAENGLHVFPVRVSIADNGKKIVNPRVEWRKASTTSAEVIGRWWAQWPTDAIGLDCGKSNIVVIDPDGEEGIAAWEEIVAEHHLPATSRAATPGGGQHWYYRDDKSRLIGNDATGKLAPKVDVRGLGGFIFAPPSSHEGGAWRWLEGEPDWENLPVVPQLVGDRMNARPPEVALAPEVEATLSEYTDLTPDIDTGFTVEEVTEYCRPSLATLANAPIGQIEDSLFKAASAIGRFVPEFFTPAGASQILLAALAKTAYDGKTWKAEKSISQGFKFGARNRATRAGATGVVPDPTDAAGERVAAALPVAVSPSTPAPVIRSRELDAFLAEVPPEYDWVIPGLLERGDRIILTGGEGHGKSTLKRQIALQAASGIQPFDPSSTFEPVRTLLVDLENSARQMQRKLTELRAVAGAAYKGGMSVEARPEGLDLLLQEDRDLLEQLIVDERPDIVIAGPIYKMVGGSPIDEEPARVMALTLDKLRTTYGFALMLEAHTPNESPGHARTLRPYGASLWRRWPEFGVHLGEKGNLTHWRGARDERQWPALLERGGMGNWPWVPVTITRDHVWRTVYAHCCALGHKLAEQKLADEFSFSRSMVHRAIEENKALWDKLAAAPKRT